MKETDKQLLRNRLRPYSTWRHLATDSLYTVLGIAHESTYLAGEQPREYVVYISHGHEKLCVREIWEFLDGRFAPVPAP